MPTPSGDQFDVIIIGSGFGGALAASVFIAAGARVLMLERGDWVARGPDNWGPDGALYSTPHYTTDAGFETRGRLEPGVQCVGGQSVFYGGVSLRLRERDFSRSNELGGVAGADWPFDYAALEPYYARAERILGVAADADGTAPHATTKDPTMPPRSTSFPHVLPPISLTSTLIADAAATLGLAPFRLPLALNHAGGNGRTVCERCLTCDAFPCAVGAKNDIASAVLPGLLARGLVLAANTRAVQLIERSGRIDAVVCVDAASGERREYRADHFVLAAGALGSPHLLLASALAARNPAGHVVGRHLMRHCAAIVYGLFPRRPNPENAFHKEIGIHDFYFGRPDVRPRGRLGAIQQVHSPPLGLALQRAPRALRRLVPPVVERMTGLLVFAEDEPLAANRVTLHGTATDRFGMPRLVVSHEYTPRDLAARLALLRQARSVLRAAGARLFYVHMIDTFSHAAGTVRMGRDARTSALDEWCRYRGIDNLSVIDGSFMPTCGAVNPSLTIAANALRAAEAVAGRTTVGMDATPGEDAPVRLDAARAARPAGVALAEAGAAPAEAGAAPAEAGAASAEADAA